jgi:hypothetical protein
MARSRLYERRLRAARVRAAWAYWQRIGQAHKALGRLLGVLTADLAPGVHPRPSDLYRWNKMLGRGCGSPARLIDTRGGDRRSRRRRRRRSR